MPRPADRARPRALPRRALPVVLLPLLALTLVLAGCGSDDDDAAAVPTVSATTAPAEPSPPSPSAAPDDAEAISITITGGEVTGVESRTPVDLGTKVRLTVTSDVTDEVHVHGYDLTEAVPAGQAVNLEFVADQAGIFEIELHDSRQVLTRLQVQ